MSGACVGKGIGSLTVGHIPHLNKVHVYRIRDAADFAVPKSAHSPTQCVSLIDRGSPLVYRQRGDEADL